MGNISQYHTGIWCYKSSGYKTAASLINYFDKYNLFVPPAGEENMLIILNLEKFILW